MVKILTNAAGFMADNPWGALDVAQVEGATVRVHWTNAPYRWHTNDGREVFMVIAGQVEMRYREGGVERSVTLGPSDIFVADVGDEHVAHPQGEARILVVERAGSI